MPRLPDFTAFGDAPRPTPSGGVASYQPADMSRAAAGMEAAGRDLQQASEIIVRTNERQDMMLAESALNRLQAARLELEAGEGGFQGVRGAGAVGPKFVEDYQQRFETTRAGIEQSLENDNQRRLFQQRVPVAGLQYRSSLLRHQAKETDAFNDKTENDTIEMARRQALDAPMDGGALASSMARIDWAIDQKATRLGWSDKTKTFAREVYRAKVNEELASVLVEQDPAGALSLLNRRLGVGQEPAKTGVAAFDDGEPTKLITLRHRAASVVQQEQNRIKAEAEKRLKVAETTIETLQKFTVTGQMVSTAYAQEVILKTAGTPYEQAARALVQQSFAGATHGSQTLPQQEQALREIDARVAAGGSGPEEKQIVDLARQITSTQRQAYKDNPWEASTRFGRQQPVPEQQIGDAAQVPQLVAQRLPLMTGVETFAGAPVSPLQPREAQAFAEKLKAMPPQARAEVLGQTGAMLSAPRAAALAEQLDKQDKPLALALKLGLDRTTAGRTVSALVLRGAQALTDKTVKKDDSALAGWRSEIATLVRGTLGDDRAEQDVIDAAYYVRAAQDQEGIAAPGFTRGIGNGAADAVAMVIGLPIERGGLKTVLPRGMKERDFDERLRGFTAEKLRVLAPTGEVYVRGAPVKVEQIANRLTEYGMKRDGAGRYVPVVRNAPITLDAQGTQLLRLEVRQ